MRRVLLTGATGFMGRTLARTLAAKPELELVTCARRGAADATVDLCDKPAVAALLETCTPDVIVHAAGRTGGDRAELTRNNVGATLSLLEAVSGVVPRVHVVLLGSAAEYGEAPSHEAWKETDPCDPVDDYGAAKLEAGRRAMALAAEKGLNVCLLRVFNVVAEEMMGRQVLGAFIQRVAERRSTAVVEMGWLGTVRDFVAMDEVVAAVEAAMDKDVSGQVINVASGRPRCVRDLIEVARNASARPITLCEAHERSASRGVLWSVGDPARCRDLLGVAPSGEVDDIVVRAVAKAGI